MAAAAAGVLGSQIAAGLVIAPADTSVPAPFELIVGGHPTPTAGSERAGRRALELAASCPADAHLLVLISGGASAMMAVPADGVTLEDKRQTTDRLLRAGADIHALNTVRKHLSAIKGGRLAAATPAPCTTLAISDVVGDDLSVIASGPTVPDETSFADALDVLARFGGVEAFPAAVIARLEAGARGATAETPKPGDARLERSSASVIGGRREAMAGAAAAAEARGYHVIRIDDPVIGDARSSAVSHLRVAMALAASAPRPACIVSSGETTVHVTGRGRGGRNQEFALALVGALASVGTPAVFGSAGTDGVDGPTDAAGAVADSTTVARARAAGLAHASDYLDDNNAYAYFAALGDLIHTGPTGTNVGDLQVMLIA